MQKELCKIVSARNFRVEYSILTNAMELEGRLIEAYGIEVTKKQRKDGVLLSETKSIKNISISEDEIRNLARLLAENYVTPITVKDVVEDFVAEGRFEMPVPLALDNVV